MSAIALEPQAFIAPGRVVRLTLLELVSQIRALTNDEDKIVASVSALLRSGRVRLTGNFRGAEHELLQDDLD